MSTNKTTKKVKEQLTNEEEEGDFFINFINKKVRNIKKKLREISELEKTSDELKREQIEKINSKEQLENSIIQYQKTKQLYKEAHKENPQEKKKEIKEKKGQEKISSEVKTSEISKEELELYGKKLINESVSFILNLIHVAQFYEEKNNRNVENNKENFSNNDFDIIYEIYKKIFVFTKNSKFEKVSIKIDNSSSVLIHYLNKSQSVAVGNKSYCYIFEIVEKIANCSSFKSRNKFCCNNEDEIANDIKLSQNVAEIVEKEYIVVEKKHEEKIVNKNNSDIKKEDNKTAKEVIQKKNEENDNKVNKNNQEKKEEIHLIKKNHVLFFFIFFIF